MSNQQHPITPPLALINQWWDEAKQNAKYDEPIGPLVATAAARWGADQELEACVKWFDNQTLVYHRDLEDDLRNARRSKPPSLKEQALAELEKVDMLWDTSEFGADTLSALDTIRRAIEQLPN